jgi:hypothetical protein
MQKTILTTYGMMQEIISDINKKNFIISNYLKYNKSDNFLFYTIRCIVANDDETSPTEPKYEEDLEFGVCHLNLILFCLFFTIK